MYQHVYTILLIEMENTGLKHDYDYGVLCQKPGRL